MQSRFLTGIFVFLSAAIVAQKPDIKFDRISVQEGLLDHSMNCVMQDHTGFIWIGGSDGLHRYDGYGFTNYQYQPGEKKYRYFKDVYRICEDKFGLFWMVAEAGIILFDPESDRSVLLYAYAYERRSDINTISPDILIDSQGTVWATYRNGVMKLTIREDLRKYLLPEKNNLEAIENSINRNFIELPFSNPGQNNLATMIFEDKDQRIMIGGTTGLFLLDKNQKSFSDLVNRTEPDPVRDFRFVRAIVQDTDNSYWIAAAGFLYHLDFRFSDKSDAQIITTTNNGIGRYRIRENEVPTALRMDHRKNILVGTDKGVYLMNKSRNGKSISFSLLENKENDPEYYGYTKSIRFIMEDRSDIVWTAQDYYGITRFNLTGSLFNSYKELIVKNFKSTDVNPLYRDDQGHLWVGTYGAGLYKVRSGNYAITHIDMFQKKNNVLAITKIKEALVWIGTDRGIVEMNTQTGTSGEPVLADLKEINRRELYVWDILKAGEVVYIATEDGVFAYSFKEKTLFQIPLVNHDTLAGRKNSVMSLLLLKNGTVLAGTALHGLVKLFPPNGNPAFEQLIANSDLAENHIGLDERHRIFEDSEGIIWIADYTGLHRFDLRTGRVSSFKLFDRISFPVAWSITEDSHKNLWIGTHYGLCRFNTTTHEVKVFGKENGLPVIIHGLNSVLREPDGRMFFGGIGGYYDFYPDSITTHDRIPPVVLTDILLYGKAISQYPMEGINQVKGIPYLRKLKLKHNQNDLTFRFSSLDYTQPAANQYAYKLEGYQDDWIKTDAGNREARYMMLKPGTYTLRVKASNSDGTWNEAGTSLKIIIRKPWYATYAALTLYLILVIAAVRGFVRWRMFRLRKEHEELENLVERRTQEIQEQSHKIAEQRDLLELQNEKIREEEALKNRFFSNISHEFRTPLSLINSPVDEMLSNPGLHEKERRKLGMIRRNSQRLLGLVNQLLDMSKFDAGKMKLELCEGDVMILLDNISGSFVSMAETGSIDFIRQLDKREEITWFDADKIEKIAMNLLSNAFKFTPAGGEIIFRAQYRNGTAQEFDTLLEFEVKDNGVGIPEKSLDKIFDRFFQVEENLKQDQVGTGLGLAFSRDLARIMHGDIEVVSKRSAGSCFKVVLPLGRKHLTGNEYVVIPDYCNRQKIRESLPEIETNEFHEEDQEGNSEKPVLLVVEDNRDLRMQLRDILESDYTVYLAVDGKAGLIRSVEVVPDLILTDLMMPNMDGLEFCSKVKNNEQTCHVPVIMLTARDTLTDKLAGLKTGADDYISKPFEIAEVKARIANLIEQRRTLREKFSREITLEPAEIIITSEDEKFLQKAISVVEEHLKDENFDLALFRKKMNLSRSTLFRRLAALTGQSPTEFIRTIRLKRAASLLKQHFGNITQVSYEVGFNDVSYFNRSFRKMFSMSPTEYERQTGKEQKEQVD